jgi:acyl-[acyl carrier protein]--UDP-N-acetylglucosamine O-acyltransferase
MRDVPTNTVGGGVDQTAVVGHAPQHRDWLPGMPAYAPIVDESARIEAFVTVDAGMYRPTIIGPRAWLMKSVHVGHDSQVGADVELAPMCSVGGHVVLEDGVRVGQGAVFKPGVRVGAGARVGMGAVVIHDVPAGEVWAGNPARRIDHPSVTDRDTQALTAA